MLKKEVQQVRDLSRHAALRKLCLVVLENVTKGLLFNRLLTAVYECGMSSRIDSLSHGTGEIGESLLSARGREVEKH